MSHVLSSPVVWFSSLNTHFWGSPRFHPLAESRRALQTEWARWPSPVYGCCLGNVQGTAHGVWLPTPVGEQDKLNMLLILLVVIHQYCTFFFNKGLQSHSVGMRLDGQSRVDGQHFEKERELPVERVLDLWPQAPREICNPLSQCPLGYPVVFDQSVAFGVSTHPKLGRQQKTKMIKVKNCCRSNGTRG